MELNFALAVSILVAVAIVAWTWYRGEGNTGSVTGMAGDFLLASTHAQDVVAAAEQLWLTGQIPADGRLDYAMNRLHELFPGLSDTQLRTVVEAAVYFAKSGLAQVSNEADSI